MIKDMLKMLNEAPEEMSVAKEPVSAAPIAGDSMSDTDFAPQPQATQAPAAAPMSAPAMPSVPAGMTTVQKEVLNKQLMLAITSELKSLIATYEKKFEGEDFTVDDAKIYINNFLESLAFQADKIAALVGEAPAGESEGIEMPQEEVVPPAPAAEPMPEPPTPEPLPDMGTEPMPIESGEASFGGFTNPGDFTNPNEATLGAF